MTKEQKHWMQVAVVVILAQHNSNRSSCVGSSSNGLGLGQVLGATKAVVVTIIRTPAAVVLEL